MLVLTRKTNESICIDGKIEVMVVQVRGNRVRLGFRAPSDVSIQRKERLPVANDATDGISLGNDARLPIPASRSRLQIAVRPR